MNDAQRFDALATELVYYQAGLKNSADHADEFADVVVASASLGVAVRIALVSIGVSLDHAAKVLRILREANGSVPLVAGQLWALANGTAVELTPTGNLE